MKNKFILSVLLTGYVLTTSCTETRDPSKGIEYRFSPEVVFPPDVPSGKNQVLHIKLKSDVYRNGVLEHTVTYTDDKKSFLISPKGDTIKSNETFNISNLNKLNTFNFYSEDLGMHNLKFIFKNSMGFTVDKEHNVSVEEGTFKFSLNPLYQEVAIDTPLEIEYSHEAYDQLKHNYQLKFDIENSSDGKKLDATLNHHKSGEWFDISEILGKLSYIPLSVGTHNVRVISKNEKGIEKDSSFIIKSRGMGEPIIRQLVIEKPKISSYRSKRGRGRSWIHKNTIKFKWELDAHSGDEYPFVKGTLYVEDFNIKQSFELKNTTSQSLHYSGESSGYNKTLPPKTITLKLELENLLGVKSVKEIVMNVEK